MKDASTEVTARPDIQATGAMAVRIMATKIITPDRIEIVTGGIVPRMKYHHGLVMKMQNVAEE